MFTFRSRVCKKIDVAIRKISLGEKIPPRTGRYGENNNPLIFSMEIRSTILLELKTTCSNPPSPRIKVYSCTVAELSTFTH